MGTSNPLSEILPPVNERFGANLTEEYRVTLRHVAQKLEEDNASTRAHG